MNPTDWIQTEAQEPDDFFGLKLSPISNPTTVEDELRIRADKEIVSNLDNALTQDKPVVTDINPLTQDGPQIATDVAYDSNQSNESSNLTSNKFKRKYETKNIDNSKRSRYEEDAVTEPNVTIETATEGANMIIRTILNGDSDQPEPPAKKLIKTIVTMIDGDDKRQVRKFVFKLKETIIKNPDDAPDKESFAALIKLLHKQYQSTITLTLLRDRHLQFLGKVYRLEKQHTNIDDIILAEGTNAIMPLMFSMLSLKEKLRKLQEFDTRRMSINRLVARFDQSPGDILSLVIKEEPELLFEFKAEPYLEMTNYDVFFHIVYEFLTNRSSANLVKYFERLQINPNIAITNITRNWKVYGHLHANTIKNFKNVVQVTGIMEIFPEIGIFLNKLN